MPPPTAMSDITIIGAGLAGVALALTLDQHGIKSTIYESRGRNNVDKTEGALMLTPNSIRILNKIGIYERIKDEGFAFEDMIFMTDKEGKILDRLVFGSEEKYGYKALRVYRQTLLNELRQLASERGIPILYNKKFGQLLGESEHGITFECADGEQVTTQVVVGADGIFSKVRKQTFGPSTDPVYNGVAAVTCSILTAGLKYPEAANLRPHQLPVSLHGQQGVCLCAPQDNGGTEMLIGVQHPLPDRSVDGWKALACDKEFLLDFFRRGYDGWSPFVQSGMDAAEPDALAIWPFRTVPKLESWSGRGGRVVIIGDAAHGMPPSAGQGANQGFEDAFALAILMSKMFSGGYSNENSDRWQEGLRHWHAMRQSTIDRLLALAVEINERRKPGGMAENTVAFPGLHWLYSLDIEKEVHSWLDKI